MDIIKNLNYSANEINDLLAKVETKASKSSLEATNTTLNNFITASAERATLAGYGITDAKIEDGVITLGDKTITPITNIDSEIQEVKEYADGLVASLVDSAPETLDTLKELATAVTENKTILDGITNVTTGVLADAKQYTDSQIETLDLANTYLTKGEYANSSDILNKLTVKTRNNAQLVVNITGSEATLNMGALNLFINGKFLRSFAPGLGGGNTSTDTTVEYKGEGNVYNLPGLDLAPSAWGAFGLNFADGNYTKVKLSVGKDLAPTISIDIDVDALAAAIKTKLTE